MDKEAERLVSSIAPAAVCTAQGWDNRIDCTIKLADGRVVGEMSACAGVTEQRLRETGNRRRRPRRG